MKDKTKIISFVFIPVLAMAVFFVPQNAFALLTNGGNNCTTCSCSCTLPGWKVPLPVKLEEINLEEWLKAFTYLESQNFEFEIKNDKGAPITTFDVGLNPLMTEWYNDVKSSEAAKIRHSQITQGNIINWIVDKADKVCQEWMRHPDISEDAGGCKRGVSNWAIDFQRDIEANVKAGLFKDLERVSFLDPLEKKKIADAYLQTDLNPKGNRIEYFIKQLYGGEPVEIQPNTTAPTLFYYLITRNETLKNTFLRSYINNLISQAQETAKLVTELGGGWWGMFEQTRKTLVVDKATGDPIEDEEYYDETNYSYVITPGQANVMANFWLMSADMISAYTSVLFSALEPATQTVIDPNGVYLSGLFINGAMQAPARSGFMFPSTLGLYDLPPTCTINLSLASEITLTGKGDSEIIKVKVAPNNGEFIKATLLTENTNLIDVNPTESLIESFSSAITVKNAPSQTTTTFVTIAGKVRNENNKNQKEGRCESRIKITVIPDTVSCEIKITPSEITIKDEKDFDSIQWFNKGRGIQLPNPETFEIKKKVDINISADPSFEDLNRFLNYIQNSLIKKVLVYLPNEFSSFVLPTAFNTKTIQAELTLKNIGEFSLKTEVNTSLDPQNPILCKAEIPVNVGYRCYSTRCPDPNCQPSYIPGQPISTACCKKDSNGSCMTTPLHSLCDSQTPSCDGYVGQRTEYCDYYTGVRLNDGKNAYCLNSSYY